MFKKLTLSLFGLALVLALPLSASAATFSGGEEFTLRADETLNENVYIGGGIVDVEGTINGDLLAAGGDLTLSGSTSEDVTVVGGDVTISGAVGEDLRVAGGEVKISGTVKGDLVVAGGYIQMTSSAKVDGNVMVTGGRLLFEGEVSGDMEVYGGEVDLNGTINGEAFVKTDVLNVGDQAVLKNGLDYTAKKEATISDSASITGEVVYTQASYGHKFKRKGGHSFGKAFTVFWLLGLISSLIMAFVLFGLTKSKLEQFVKHTTKKFWPETLRGLILMILMPILIVILLVTVIGTGLGLVLIPLFIFVAAVAKVVAGIMAGSFIFYLFTKKIEVSWKTILTGMITLSIVMLIPIIGWIVGTLMFLAAFGSLWMQLCNHFKN